jgi:RimJ/RimL family protein N-acetyltransferase
VKFAKALSRDVPSGYPSELEQLRTLADGREVFLRPIVPADLDALREAIANADPQTIHDRFLGGRPPADDQTLRHLTTLDYVRRSAIVAFDPSRRGVAIARYEGTANTDLAEVAVVVDPAWRQVGLATALLRMFADAALERGITRFAATSYADNIDVHDILSRSGLPHRRIGTGAVVDDIVDLDESIPPAEPRSAN